MEESKQPLFDWIKDNQLKPENLLPHRLPDSCMEILSAEVEDIKNQVETENLAEGFVSIILQLSAIEGHNHIDHELIVERLDAYIKNFSLEKMKRTGLIKSYEEATLEEIFDTERQMDVTLGSQG